jgi:hypothetical protein
MERLEMVLYEGESIKVLKQVCGGTSPERDELSLTGPGQARRNIAGDSLCISAKGVVSAIILETRN